jgi:hypothetical protein
MAQHEADAGAARRQEGRGRRLVGHGVEPAPVVAVT